MILSQKTKRGPIAEINVVPYIDVMLVLLVIFMVTAPLMTQGVHVELPEATAKTIENKSNATPIVVSVNQRGQLFLNIAANSSRPIAPDELYAEVAAALLKDEKRPVMVKGDRRVNYAMILDTMVLLQKAGAPSVGLQTQDPVAKDG